MFSNTKKTAMVLFAVAVFLLLVDRLLKSVALHAVIDFPLIGGLLKFSFAKNFYIAFSLPFGGRLLIFFISVIMIALLIHIIRLFKSQRLLEASLFAFTFLGAFSNLYDRLNYGFVIDYLDLKYFTVFNVADSMIVLSIASLIFLPRWFSKNTEEQK